MNTPLVTVITPYYFNSSTLISSIDSVMNQTYTKIQYILINDGSNDFEYDSINNYMTNKLKTLKISFEFIIIQNEHNLGTVKTLNKGLTYATGKYVYILAADDYFYDENVLTDWTNEFISTNAKVITAKRAVYDNLMSSFKYTSPNAEEIDFLVNKNNKEIFESLIYKNYIFGCCTAFETSFLKLLNGFDEKYRLIEDHPLILKLLRSNINIHFYDRCVIKYRLGGISNAGNIDRKYLKEANRIFFREALPFINHKFKSIKLYFKRVNFLTLKHDRKKYSLKYNRNTKLGNISYCFIIFVLHPLYSIKRIFHKP